MGTFNLGTYSMPVFKQCGETLGEAYEAQVASSGGGGSLSGPGQLPGYGSNDPFAGCRYIPGGTSTVEVTDGEGNVTVVRETVPAQIVCPGM